MVTGAGNGPFRAGMSWGVVVPRPYGLGWKSRPFRPKDARQIPAEGHLTAAGAAMTIEILIHA